MAQPEQRTATRQRILDEALGLFTTQGYANTSVSEIADRMDFTKAALYYHFRSKDDILLELLTPLLDDLDELADTTPAASEGDPRRHALARYLDVMVRHGRLVGMLTNDVSTMGHPAVAGRAMPAFQRFRAQMIGPDAELDVVIAAAGALSALGGALQVVPEPTGEQRETILRVAVAALEAGTPSA